VLAKSAFIVFRFFILHDSLVLAPVCVCVCVHRYHVTHNPDETLLLA